MLSLHSRWVTRDRLAVLAVLATLVLLSLGAAPAPVRAASSTVACGPNRLNDLVAAVTAANTGGPSTVTLEPGCEFTIVGALGETYLPPITGHVTIEGNAATFDANRILSSCNMRLFEVRSGGTLVINNLTMQEFCTDQGGIGLVLGGALVINNSILRNSNSPASGAAIRLNDGSVTLFNSVVSGNFSRGGGAGIYGERGSITITDSTFTENESISPGGGVHVGFLFGEGQLTITNSTFHANQTQVEGGALAMSSGTATISGSTFSSNLASSFVADSRGGAVSATDASLSIFNSTFSGNVARTTGGGLYVRGSVSLVNSTVSGNHAGSPELRATPTVGGGIYHLSGTLTLLHSTISGNVAYDHYTDVGSIDDSYAGGVYSLDGTRTFNNTIIAANSASSVSTVSSNCLIEAFTGSNNLQDQGTTCGAAMTSVASAGLAGDGGKTSGLSANGGPTKTVALQAGSPAIGTGSTTHCADARVGNKDQRGFGRGGACDIGAYETDATTVQRTLTVTKAGTGTGKVTSTPGTINCGATCQSTVADSTPLTLTATPDNGHTFIGWTGACWGTDPCVVPVDHDRAVTAIFAEEAGPETAISGGQPANPTNQTSASISFSSPDVGVTFECKLDAAAFAPCTSPHALSNLGEGSHTFQVRAKDAGGVVDPSPASVTWTVDTSGPNTTISGGQPPAVTNQRTASISFTASEPGSSFECKLDMAAFAACTSPHALSNLTDGSHTFEVRAKDATGNVDASPAGITWTVDTVAPETTMDYNRDAFTNQSTITMTFRASEPGATFLCRLDADDGADTPLSPCTSPKTFTLPPDHYELYVTAVDAAGNADPTPAQEHMLVDPFPPETELESTPPVISGPNVTFVYLTSDPIPDAGVMDVECRLDGGAWNWCRGDFRKQYYTNLPTGSHTFEARAYDYVHNIDPTPARYTWTVDATPPTTTLTTNPPLVNGAVRGTPNVMVNAVDQPGLSGVDYTEYRIDGGAWTRYTGPFTPTLSPGSHTLGYRSTDKVGNVETEKTLAIILDTTPPEAYYQFDAATRGVQVFGRDEANGSGVTVDGPVAPATCTNQRTGQQCIYRVSDKAGNSMTLTLLITRSATQTRVRVVSYQVSGQGSVTPLSNETVVDFGPASGALSTLTQCAGLSTPPVLGQPSGTRKVCARWTGGATTTVEYVTPSTPSQTRPGMALLRIVVSKNGLSIEAP